MPIYAHLDYENIAVLLSELDPCPENILVVNHGGFFLCVCVCVCVCLEPSKQILWTASTLLFVGGFFCAIKSVTLWWQDGTPNKLTLLFYNRSTVTFLWWGREEGRLIKWRPFIFFLQSTCVTREIYFNSNDRIFMHWALLYDARYTHTQRERERIKKYILTKIKK